MATGNQNWTELPEALEAAAAGQLGVLVRLARVAAGLTLVQAGQRLGYSAATLSRIERGRQPLRDIALLRQVAEALAIPPHMFGLVEVTRRVEPPRKRGIAKVRRDGALDDGIDPVRRRELLGGLTGLALAPLLSSKPAIATADSSPAGRLVQGLEEVLLSSASRPTGMALEPRVLSHSLRTTMVDFQASRYSALAERLPQLIESCDAAGDMVAPDLRAEVFNAAVQALIRVGAGTIEWVAADRAMSAAHASGNPRVIASVTRNMAILCRRSGRYELAQRLALEAADALPVRGRQVSEEALSLYGILLCNAGYTAAKAGDRTRSDELLNDASDVADRLGVDANARWTAFGPTNVLLFKVSASHALGDAGKAIEYARRVPRGAVRLPERQSRFWVDVAKAWHQWGKPIKCYEALTVAERLAPEEVRSRRVVRELVVDLLTCSQQPRMNGITSFARRVHVAA